MKRHYLVETEEGTFETWATSPKKAIANIRYRMANGRRWDMPDASEWTAKEVA